MFERAKRWIRSVSKPKASAMQRAADRIQEKLTRDATTRRGNVPSYGKFGDVPISATAKDGSVHVVAADWVMVKARELGQPGQWAEIAKEEALRDLRGDE